MQQFCEHFQEKYGLPILQLSLKLLEKRQVRGMYFTDRVLTLLLHLMDVSIQNSSLFKEGWQPNFEFIVSKLIFPFLCFTREDEELWLEDPSEYLRSSFELCEDVYNPRLAAGNIFVSLTEERPSLTVDPLANFLLFHLKSSSSSNPYVMDGVLFAIGICRKAFLRELKGKLAFESLLATYVVPELFRKDDLGKHGHLVSRACWLLGLYVRKIPNLSQNIFSAIAQGIVGCVQRKEIPIKVEAAITLSQLIKTKRCYQEFRRMLENILNVYFDIVKQVEHEDIYRSIEILVATYPEDILPYVGEVCEKLGKEFLRMMSDEECNGNGDDNDDDDEFHAENSVRILNCLKIIMDAVADAVAKKNNDMNTLDVLEAKLLPLVAKCLELEAVEYVEEAMNIFSTLTFISPKITPNMWTIYDLLFQNYKKWDSVFIEDFLPPLDNLLSKDFRSFLLLLPFITNNKDNNNNNKSQPTARMKQLWEFLEMFTKRKSNEDSIIVGKILIILFLNAPKGCLTFRDSSITTDLTPFREGFVAFFDLILKTLSQANTVALQIICFDAV